MKQDVFVSIIVPSYNSKKYLNDCIASLERQSDKNFEVILVDDGSIDGSADLCDEIAESTELSVKVIHQKNQGQIKARLNGVKEATGNYCMFLDSDDLLREDAIEMVHDCARQYQAEMIIFNATRFDRNREQLFWNDYTPVTSRLDKRQVLYDVIGANRFNNICFKAIKTEIMKGVKNADSHGLATKEDLLMQLPVFDRVKTIVYLPEALYRYRYNENSVTNTWESVNDYGAVCFLIRKLRAYGKKWKVLEYKSLTSKKFLEDIILIIKKLIGCKNTIPRTEKKAVLSGIANDKMFRKLIHEGIQLMSRKRRLVLWLLYYRMYHLLLLIIDKGKATVGNFSYSEQDQIT